VPVAVIFAGAVAFFVARETEPPPPEVPLNERLEAECKRMFPDDGDLAALKASNDCKIELLTRSLSEINRARMDDAYRRVFK
jgi:hypothetical protein